MRFSSLATLLFLTSSFVNTASIPSIQDVSIREVSSLEQAYNDLWKRKGGGGGGKGGSSGGSSSSSSSSSSSGSSSSSSSGSRSGSGSSSSSSFSSSSNAGGRTRSGSGTSPSYGGGRNYAGGASVPYSSGKRSASGITPFLLPVAFLGFFPGLWLAGAYGYPYSHPYRYRNSTRNATAEQSQITRRDDVNLTVDVTCLCQEYSVCGCDDTNNNTLVASYMNVSDGDAPQNSSIVRFVDFGNGTTKLFINGTLENGTTASGGTDPSNDSEASMGAQIAKFSGYWVMAATVLATVILL